MSTPIYKYGVTGFVELQDHVAMKYSEFDCLYWLKEYSVLSYLWHYQTDNIVKFNAGSFTMKKNPINQADVLYQELALDLYPATLHDRKIYRDHDVCQIMLDLASALKFLHSKKIWHRDIKPSNIALDNSNRAVLIDFSHAHKMDIPLNKLCKSVLTYWYRAPEVFAYQQNGREMYTEAVDMWALGMTLLEIITGTSFANFYTYKIELAENRERVFGRFLESPVKAKNMIKDYFYINKRPFAFTDTYWSWINRMLDFDQYTRISASELYNEIIAFTGGDETIVIPVNGRLTTNIKYYKVPDVNLDVNLYGACVEYAVHIKRVFNLLLNIERISDTLAYLVKSNFITVDNYEHTLPACIIVIEQVLYDGFRELEEYGTLDTDQVRDAIMELACDYGNKLFSVNACVDYRDPLASFLTLEKALTTHQ